MKTMLYHKFIILSTSCAVQIMKLYNSVIHFLTRKRISYLNFMQLSWYHYSDTENKIKKIPHSFVKYLSNINPILREKLISNYFLLKANNNNLYLIDDNISNKFATLIKDDLLENMCYTIEFNPGYGLLTRSLLDAGVSYIHLYECHKLFYQELQSLKTTFPNRVKITHADIFKITKLLTQQGSVNVPNGYFNDLFDNIPIRKWEEKSCVQIIGTITKCAFIRHLLLSIIFQTSFMMHGRAIFYLALPQSIWNKLTSRNNRNVALYTMFNVLLNSTMLGTLEREGFLPMKKSRKLKITKTTSNNDDDQLLYVVKLEPKSNILSLFGGREQLIYFWHFVRHYLYKPTMKIIPLMEKVIPGLGIKLIEKDYNIFTQFNELSVDQIIDLYKELKSYSEFNDNSFSLSGNEIRKIYDPFMEEKYN